MILQFYSQAADSCINQESVYGILLLSYNTKQYNTKMLLIYKKFEISILIERKF
jgi:hypothetical protein